MDTKRSICVLLVDDHPKMREVLGEIIRTHEGLEVIAEARDGLDAIEFLNQQSVDAVLMDISMPRLDGIKATRAIRCLWPSVPIIGISTASPDDPACRDMLKAGADSVLTKSEAAGLLPAEIIRLSARPAASTFRLITSWSAENYSSFNIRARPVAARAYGA